MPDIRLDRIKKHYGTVSVVSDVSLAIRDGEFFTLVGPSGCGKSTLLNVIAGLEPLTAGEIFFDDRPISHLSPKDRNIAMVFQSYALYPHKTVFENIAFPLRLNKRPAADIEREVARVAALLGLESQLAKKPAQISGGERQRVALGRALVRKPAVFLMDEPLSNLDAQLRVQTRSEIRKLHRILKTTMIYVTHDQEEALSLSDRLAVLDQGVVQQVGTPLEVYRCPENVTVAKFIGSPQMNLIPGRVVEGSPPSVDVAHARIPISIRAPLICREPVCVPRTGRQDVPRTVLVGIRPEDIVVRDGEGALNAAIVSVEPAGAHSWVELNWGDHVVWAASSRDFTPTPGRVAALDVHISRLHFFDPESGDRMPIEGLA